MPSSLASRLLARARRGAPDDGLHPIKKRAIDHGFDAVGARSFADLGGVWAVDGGYSFYALERHAPERAVLVDEHHTDAVHERAAEHPALELVEANFGAPETAEHVGQVDAVLLFDVLLHQVAPDWDQILELYAPRTRAFVLVNPQWTDGDGAVRLLDLGREEYLASVPPMGDLHDGLFDRLDEINPQRGRPWRDVHDVWQWGITDQALERTMAGLGFTCAYREDAGPWQGLDRFANRAFVFVAEGR